jgi:uncharacterized membrane protein YtjA (UPF0391 family)
MLRWAIALLVIAITAGIPGFAGLMVAAAGIAKLLFYLFLILFLVSLIAGLVPRPAEKWFGSVLQNLNLSCS